MAANSSSPAFENFRLFGSAEDEKPNPGLGLGFLDSQQPPLPPPPPCLEVLYSEVPSSVKYNVEPVSVGGLTMRKVWAYETVSTLTGRVANKKSGDAIPRILRWSCSHSPGLSIISTQVFGTQRARIIVHLVASAEETTHMNRLMDPPRRRDLPEPMIVQPVVEEAGRAAEVDTEGAGASADLDQDPPVSVPRVADPLLRRQRAPDVDERPSKGQFTCNCTRHLERIEARLENMELDVKADLTAIKGYLRLLTKGKFLDPPQFGDDQDPEGGPADGGGGDGSGQSGWDNIPEDGGEEDRDRVSDGDHVPESGGDQDMAGEEDNSSGDDEPILDVLDIPSDVKGEEMESRPEEVVDPSEPPLPHPHPPTTPTALTAPTVLTFIEPKLELEERTHMSRLMDPPRPRDLTEPVILQPAVEEAGRAVEVDTKGLGASVDLDQDPPSVSRVADPPLRRQRAPDVEERPSKGQSTCNSTRQLERIEARLENMELDVKADLTTIKGYLRLFTKGKFVNPPQFGDHRDPEGGPTGGGGRDESGQFGRDNIPEDGGEEVRDRVPDDDHASVGGGGLDMAGEEDDSSGDDEPILDVHDIPSNVEGEEMESRLKKVVDLSEPPLPHPPAPTVLTFIEPKPEGRVSTQEVFSLSNSDLVPGKYEGGLKLWEGALDLVKALCGEVENGHLSFAGKRVLELGCGHGLPGIYACLEDAAAVHFQDFNAEVLRCLTIPNVAANLSEKAEALPTTTESDARSAVRYFAGDWSEMHKILPFASDNEEKLSGSFDGYDIVLMAETVYSLSTLKILYKLITRCLSRPHGVVYLAGKKHYFGVGGGTRRFLSVLDKEGEMVSKLIAEVADGSSNVREVWKLSLK